MLPYSFAVVEDEFINDPTPVPEPFNSKLLLIEWPFKSK